MMKTIIKTNYFSRVFLYGLIFSLCIFPLSVKARQTSPKKDLCIVIDPGHGGIQSGTQRGTVEEKTLNLKIAQYLKEALEKEGYICTQAFSGTEARMILQGERYSVILLDLMLPGIPGEEVLRDIRKKGNTPVIILTAKDTIDDKVEFLRGGADDYVTKPFDIKEVTARVEVQIRRAETTGRKEEEHRFTYQELELNKGDFTVKVGNTELPHITKQEFSILELLLKHPKKVFSKEEMFEYAWEEQYMGETKTLDVHISNIRKKIKAVTDKEYIETVWGIGYRLHP